jgi:hypothetical protein
MYFDLAPMHAHSSLRERRRAWAGFASRGVCQSPEWGLSNSETDGWQVHQSFRMGSVAGCLLMPWRPEWVKPRRAGAIETWKVITQHRKGLLAIVADDKCQKRPHLGR